MLEQNLVKMEIELLPNGTLHPGATAVDRIFEKESSFRVE